LQKAEFFSLQTVHDKATKISALEIALTEQNNKNKAVIEVLR